MLTKTRTSTLIVLKGINRTVAKKKKKMREKSSLTLCAEI